MKGGVVRMDGSLTDDERTELKAGALKRLRDLEASLDRSEEIHQYEERGLSHMVPPSEYEAFNRYLRDLQRAGENIPDWAIRPPHTIKWRAAKSAPLEDWANGSMLRAEIKRVLKTIDSQD